MIFKGVRVQMKPCDGLKLLALHGTGTQGGKKRVREFFSRTKSITERAEFLKMECQYYGYGSKPQGERCRLFHVSFMDRTYSYQDHLGVEHRELKFTYKELAAKIAECIDDGTYGEGR